MVIAEIKKSRNSVNIQHFANLILQLLGVHVHIWPQNILLIIVSFT